MPVEPRVVRRAGVVLVAMLALLAGCTPTPEPTHSPSSTAAPRPFTVATTGPVTTTDPAVATGDTDSLLVTSIFQRLMVVLPASGELKPDAADCLFTSRLVYQCTLTEGLTFHNGDVLDSSDVKFSLQRALRMDAPGTSIGLLASLKRIDTPDARTVTFTLNWPDNQFGYALAGQATSIVDEKTFDPDTALPLTSLPIGSGPLSVSSIDDAEVHLTRFEKYLGPKTALMASLQVQVLADSVAAEAAIAKGSADVVWRSLDNAAVQRISDEITANSNHATAMGFTRFPLTGVRITRLAWSASSKLRSNDTLREGVMKALQPDRTLDSIIPVGVAEHVKSFAVGGRPKLPEFTGKRINLTLRYDATAPGHGDLARLLRDRIEGLDGVSVRLVTDGAADLYLSDRPAWVNNAVGWLQSYLAHPLPDRASKLQQLDQLARSSTGNARTVALAEIQQQAAVDGTVMPVSQGDGILFLGPNVKLLGDAFGSGEMLGLWGFANA